MFIQSISIRNFATQLDRLARKNKIWSKLGPDSLMMISKRQVKCREVDGMVQNIHEGGVQITLVPKVRKDNGTSPLDWTSTIAVNLTMEKAAKLCFPLPKRGLMITTGLTNVHRGTTKSNPPGVVYFNHGSEKHTLKVTGSRLGKKVSIFLTENDVLAIKSVIPKTLHMPRAFDANFGEQEFVMKRDFQRELDRHKRKLVPDIGKYFPL